MTPSPPLTEHEALLQVQAALLLYMKAEIDGDGLAQVVDRILERVVSLPKGEG